MSDQFKQGETVYVEGRVEFDDDGRDNVNIRFREGNNRSGWDTDEYPILRDDISRTPPMSEYDEEVLRCADAWVEKIQNDEAEHNALVEAIHRRAEALRPKTAEEVAAIAHDQWSNPGVRDTTESDRIVAALREAGLLVERDD